MPAPNNIRSAMNSLVNIAIPAFLRLNPVGIPAYIERAEKSALMKFSNKEISQCQTIQTRTFIVAKGSVDVDCLLQLWSSSLQSLPCHSLALARHLPGISKARSKRHLSLSTNKLHHSQTASGGRPLASAFCVFKSFMNGAATC